jgi:diguanylate cyclase (GGDEF)-like protein
VLTPQGGTRVSYSKTLGPPLVAASVAMIVLANFFVVWLLATAVGTSDLLASAWPVALTSTVAVILVMSFLHQALLEILIEMECREQKARDFGLRDPLTGLANRILLEDRLSAARERWRRDKENFAVLMLDLDHFKKVNDVLGHHVGDQLLKAVSERLQAEVRDMDTVARTGGDEFVIIQSNITGVDDVRKLCRRILQALSNSFTLEGREVNIGTSIGFVLARQTNGCTIEYLRRADIALYRAKDSGRNRFQYFSAILDAEVHRRAEIEDALRRALRDGTGLDVHYQPQIDVFGNIHGVEALLRFEHPVYGKVSPTEFIPAAEGIGVINELGEFVFKRACEAARRLPLLFVGVNVSSVQFARDTRLANTFKRIADEAGVPCEQIELEIMEDAFEAKEQHFARTMHSLRREGFRIALDNFGTGHCSLSHLRTFAVDKIKLDRSFAQNHTADRSIAVIRGITTLAHSLGLEVVAEGIETAEQEQVALEAGCDALQGFRYGQPVQLSQLEGLPQPFEAAA